MTQEQSLIPCFIQTQSLKKLFEIMTFGLGLSLLISLSQIAVRLTFTPVPITGQTFGVALVSLLWGRKRAIALLMTYFTLGSLGLPIFALGRAGLTLGPTSGYLLGMILASGVMGELADRGWTKTFIKTWLVSIIGSIFVFSAGIFILSFFLPFNSLLKAGFLPFLPGDIIKNILASSLAFKANQLKNRK